MLTLTKPLIYSEKSLRKRPEVDNFLSSLKKIVSPIVKSKTIEEALQQIIKTTPVYIAFRENFIDGFKAGYHPQVKASEEYRLFLSDLSNIMQVKEKEKAIESHNLFIDASKKILDKIEKTPKERLSYIIKGDAGSDLLGKMIYTEFLLHCFREFLLNRTSDEPKIFKWIADSFYAAAQEFSGYVDSLLNEWDILTDTVVMGAIKKSHEARKLTGKPMAGSKTLQEFLHDLEN